MNLGITGASGFLGRTLVDLALRRGHEVIAFSRSVDRRLPGCEMRPFSLDREPSIEGCDALIHLAGESVLGLWTTAKKQRIRESRVQGTRRLAEAIRAAPEGQRPEAFICASGVGIYGDGGDTELTEDAPLGCGYLAETAHAWEQEAAAVEKLVRVVPVRTSVVLGLKGGALQVMAPIFRSGLGGRLGSGQQWMPWIHLHDWAMLILFAVENQEVRGPVNAAAPWPVRNCEFTRTLAQTVRRPAWFATPAWALRCLGDFSRELLESRRVVPGKATELGFRFAHPELPGALRDLLP